LVWRLALAEHDLWEALACGPIVVYTSEPQVFGPQGLEDLPRSGLGVAGSELAITDGLEQGAERVA